MKYKDPWWWLALVVFLIVPGAWLIGVFLWIREKIRAKLRERRLTIKSGK